MTRQNSQPVQVPFPVNGLDKNFAYGAQPKGTTADAKNVRAYDAIDRRLRGGSRPGLSKWSGYASQIEGTNDIINMNRLTTTPSESPGSALVAPFCGKAGTNQIQTHILSTGAQEDALTITGTTNVHEIVRDYAGNMYAVGEISDAGSNCWKLNPDLTISWELQVGGVNVLDSIDYDPITHRLVVTGERAGDNAQVWILDPDNGAELNSVDPQEAPGGSLVSVRFDSTGNVYVANRSSAGTSWKALIKYNTELTELWSWSAKQGSATCAMKTLFVTAADGVIVGGQESDEWDDPSLGTNTNDMNVWGFDSEGTLLWYYLTDDGGAGAAENLVDNVFQTSGETDKVYVGKMGGDNFENIVKLDISNTEGITEDWTYQTSTVTTDKVQAIDEDSDGDIIIGGDESNTWAGAGTSKNIWRLKASDGTLHDNVNWPIDAANVDPVTDFALTVKANSYSATSRQSALTLVMSDGDIVAIRDVSGTPTEINPTDGLARLSNIPFSQPAFGRMFFIDGINEVHYTMYDDSADDIVAQWIPTSGQLPRNPKLMTLYRGRIVLSGVASDPHNWFMSKVGDPFNWDYTPSTATVIQAVAGNNSEAGLIGDFITALIPYNDDLLVIGGDHTIWIMSGDPAAGGSVDEVSDRTGILWGKAWTTGPKGEIYFAGTDGVYQLIPGQSLENITDKRIKKIYDAIDRSADRVLLEWDYQQHGLMMLVVDDGWDITNAQTTYFWEERTGAWWEDTYPKAIGPLSMFAYDADLPADKALLLGGADGFIRQVDFSIGYDIAANNDQTVIASYVEYPPLFMNHDRTNTKLTELSAIMGESSGDVDLLLKVAESSERLSANASTKFKRTLSAGRNRMKPRLAANTIGLELNKSSASRWAIDSMNAVVSSQGKVRRIRSS